MSDSTPVVPPLPEGAVTLWKWLNVCPDETYVEWSELEVDASLGKVDQIEGAWMPLAAFHALAAKAERCESAEALLDEADRWVYAPSSYPMTHPLVGEARDLRARIDAQRRGRAK